jgi:hypothetical protein
MYALLAAGRSRDFFMIEALGHLLFLVVLALLLRLEGLDFAGLAHSVMSLAQFLLAGLLVRRHLGTVPSAAAWRQLAILTAAMALTYGLALWSAFIAGLVGVGIAVLLGVQGLLRLSDLVGLEGPLGRIAKRLRSLRPA